MSELFTQRAWRRAWRLGLAAAWLLAAGCPLIIVERCEADADCAGGQQCLGGECAGVASAKVGAGCEADRDCGAGLTCGSGFPGGYCLGSCAEGHLCPVGTTCVPELGQCLRSCGATCTRPGYGCVEVPLPKSPTRACAPLGGGPSDGGFDAGCDGACYLGCATDFTCPADRRCEDTRCETGLRLGATCASGGECPTYSHCDLTFHRCDQWCANDGACAGGYRCSPDGFCIEACSAAPSTLGLTCESSPDCARCGYCVAPADGGAKRCRQRCLLDRDCGDGGPGACELHASFRVCVEG